MDQYLPDTTGVELTSALRHELPDLVVLMLTSDASDETMLAAIEAGASGYLLKDEPAGNVIAAVPRAASGATLIPASVVQRLLSVRREQDAARSRQQRAIPALTPREKTVLTLMERGLTAKAVADELGISWDTARDHIQNVIEKLDAHSKPEAVFRARQLGLLAAGSGDARDSGGRVARHDRQ
jgi:DNA-binding NarL/FixJ family response regulator